MSKRTDNAHILTLNVSLEYEKSEVNAGFFYKSADERAALVAAERKYTDDKVNKIIQFKNDLEAAEGKQINIIVVNQKGIDPPSLDLLQKSGIVGLRRAKRRNMERLIKACGGVAVNSVDDLKKEYLGFAKLVYEHTLGDDKFTFIEGCSNPTSCSILIKGANDHTLRQIQDSINDGLRAVVNAIEDLSLIPGAGAFECAAHLELHKFKQTVQGRAKIGVQAFADALLIIPKTLANNSGLDATTAVIELLEHANKGERVGLDIESGNPILPEQSGIWDNYRVKKQFLHLG
jgi:T-complex protein 1 subunit zeta